MLAKGVLGSHWLLLLSIFRGEFVAISSYVIYFNLDDESNVGNMF